MDTADLSTVALLDDDIRRALYSFVRTSDNPVTRDAAAAAVGISRKLAAFHLDKLVDAGLLTARIESIGPRRAGRLPKLYEPSAKSLSVQIPQREVDLLASLLLEGLGPSQKGARSAVLRAARARGLALGASEAGSKRPGRPSARRLKQALVATLDRLGFEPADASDAIRLRNCPFHPLAGESPEFVCGVNRELLCGVVDGVGASTAFDAQLAPAPGWCCVELVPTKN